MDSANDPEPTTDPAAAVDVDAEQRRLDELGEHIEATRKQVEHDLDPGKGERTFAESGDAQSERADDQTIAPPG